jgi:hypothetical protein
MTPVERAFALYLKAVEEPDAVKRDALLASCFAENGRLVTASREIVGRAAMSSEIARFLAQPDCPRVRVTSQLDAGRSTYRVRSQLEKPDGTRLEFFDAGEVDADGRISTILTFAGPLPDASAD